MYIQKSCRLPGMGRPIAHPGPGGTAERIRVKIMEQMTSADRKTLYDMTNRELFCVLAGDKGIVYQMYLQDALRKYLASHPEEADLQTMVRTVVDEEADEM